MVDTVFPKGLAGSVEASHGSLDLWVSWRGGRSWPTAICPKTILRLRGGLQKDRLRYACGQRVLHRAGGARPATLRGDARVLRRRALGCRGRRSVRLLACGRAPDGFRAARWQDGVLCLQQDRPAGRRGAPAPRLSPVKARATPLWPAAESIPCDHAGLFLLVPRIVELGLHELIGACKYPSTKELSAWHSLGSLLLAKCARTPRVSHAHALADDDALGLLLGLTALPKATHLTSYSYRVRRSSNEQLLAGVTRRLRELGLATGAEGFNLDFHAIRHHGDEAPLEKHYVPRRSQRTRAVLTFFAQDHASTEMVYANADLTKTEQAREIIAFADYWQKVAGTDPGLLVFDSKLTTYKVLSELTERGIRWLTLRERGPKLIADLNALPASEWKTVRVERSGRYRAPEIHDQLVKINDMESPVRQLAMRNIGREQPTLLITNDLERTTKQLFARYAERMGIENELDAYISGFHIDVLSSGLPLNVDLDTTLTVIAGNLYRLLARRLARYEHATPDRLWRHFLDSTGKLHIDEQTLTLELRIRTYHPVLIDAGLADQATPIPWLDGRQLRFRFLPR